MRPLWNPVYMPLLVTEAEDFACTAIFNGRVCMSRPEAARILIVDDNRKIHDEYRKVLAFSASDAGFTDLECKPQGEAGRPPLATLEFRVDSAYDGQEAARLRRARGIAAHRNANQRGPLGRRKCPHSQ